MAGHLVTIKQLPEILKRLERSIQLTISRKVWIR